MFRAGQYSAAIGIYGRGAGEARKRGDPRSELRFLNNLGSAEFQVYRHRDAIRSYLRARELAAAQHDMETLGAVSFNLSSLYQLMGNGNAAAEAAAAGIALPPEATRTYRAQLLIQMAKLRTARDPDGAAALQREAIETARERLDGATESQAWNELGATLLGAGRLREAEAAALEGYRLRKLWRNPRIHYSYETLGRIRTQQGDPAGAEAMFDRAIEEARRAGPPAMWSAHYERGRARLAQSRLREAYSDFGAALRYVGMWRAEVIPADAFRVSAETELHRLYTEFIEAAARLYRETGRPAFAEEALAASEANRAVSLRALWAGEDLSRQLPPEYAETLAQLRQAEAALMQRDSPALAATESRLRLRLAEMEARAGLDLPAVPPTGQPVERKLLGEAQRALGAGEALFAFHTGERESYVWAIARDRWQWLTIPGSGTLNAAVERLAGELRENRAEAAATGAGLYRELFGAVDARTVEKPVWIVAPDGPLFELPFAALVEKAGGAYVVERHAVRGIPGLAAMVPLAAEPVAGAFVGLGDPIYNRADPRLGRDRAAALPRGERDDLELARLAGSGREVDACAAVWRAQGHEAVTFKGAAATRSNLLAAIRKEPPVLHLAAHILFSRNGSGAGMLALSLDGAGRVEWLGASEISTLGSAPGLVVLDGCSSGKGPVLPGAGLMGLTRAWLAAGARAVVVTRWPAADQDAGGLFRAFYESLPAASTGNRTPVSLALQRAQIASLRGEEGARRPSVWASYFCVERN